MTVLVDPTEWAERSFGTCDFGDSRRTQRLVLIGQQVAARPDGSTPDQTESWGDCKAVYRFMDCDEVTHADIISPHCEQTRRSCPAGSTQLILCDTTEIDFGRSAQGLGPVGKQKGSLSGKGRGFFLHSGLMRDAETGVVRGLAGQELFHRQRRKPKTPKNTTRRDPNRESIVWGQLIDHIGPPPEGVKWIHVCDRSADDYEVILRAAHKRCGWVIRVARLNRKILTPTGDSTTLAELLATAPAHRREVAVPPRPSQPARAAQVELRYSAFKMPAPSRGTAWIREHAPPEPLTMWVVELQEVSPPPKTEPLHWVLLTSEEVINNEQAQTIIEHYKKRWGIEEYHKALKTGCHVEERLYRTSARLERVTGLLAVLAVRLLQMRTLAQAAPDTPADQIAPREWVETLAAERHTSANDMTIHQFVRHLAGLGGYLGRKRDGAPGWITLWRGLEKLLLILRGVRQARKRCG